MSLKIESPDSNNIGIKVEGDLGDLQIIEDEDSESEDDHESFGLSSSFGSPVGPVAPSLANILTHAKSGPSFGHVAVTNSENVQFGNNTIFNGPVTIKQVVQTSTGVDNASYRKTDDENIPNGKTNHSKSDPITVRKFKIKTWHKLSFSAIGIVLLSSICAVVLITQQRDHPQSDHDQKGDEDSPSGDHTQVLGLCRESVHIILLTVFLVPITCLLLFIYSLLLTNKVMHHNEIAQKNGFHQNSSEKCNKDKGFQTADPILIAPGHLRIVSRTDWLAQPVDEGIEKIKQPVPWVVITHTATEGCFMQSECVLRVRLIQTFHIESRGWSDIAYNFLVGGDGSAYYGRGWDEVGSHTKGYNRHSIGIAFIGTFNTEEPTKQQVDACKKLLQQGVAEGKLAEDYKLFAHRQLMSSLSPGDKVYNIIKTWPHFVNDTTDVDSLVPK